MNDQQLLKLIRENKTDKAFNDLYRYYPVVQKMVLSNGGSKDDAYDTYQEALIVLFRKVRETDFVLTSSLNTYLYSVSRFIWRDMLKKQKKHQSVDFSIDMEENVAADLQHYQENEKSSKLAEKVIANLSERCRDLLRLFYFDSWSMKQIAEKFSYTSENVAKNQKYKCIESARQRLKELQQQEG